MVMAPGGNLSGNVPGSLKPAHLDDSATSRIFWGVGLPTFQAIPGSFYFRSDKLGDANQRIYVRTPANVWVGIL